MAQRGNSWELPIGDGATYNIQIMNDASPPTAMTGVYAGTEPLTATVWQGSKLAATPGVITPAWVSGPLGTTTATVNGGVTGTMAVGYYKVKLEVTYQGVTSPYYGGWLSLQAIPGTATPPPTYTTFQNLLDKGGTWLPRLQESTGETSFLFEQGRARSWLDSAIVARSRVYAYTFDLNYATIYGMFPWGPVESPDYVITGYLEANDLIVTDETIEICTYKSLSLICQNRVNFDDAGDDWLRRSNYYNAQANRTLRSYRCQIDTNDDGYADIAFHMGVFQFR
jgi:hypothetical protein